MNESDMVFELVGAINAIMAAAERGNDPDHDALAVIRFECEDVLKTISDEED